MMKKRPVKGRFAPSPTGRIHLGNIFCALIAWLAVRSANGEMILRIEDLDPDRSKKEYAVQLEKDLHWLGLDWDIGGISQPQYCQSKRTAFYAQAYAALEEQNLLYPCFCTRAERAASAPHTADGASIYSGHCRNLSPEEIVRLSASRKPAIRFRVPEGCYSFTDGVQGKEYGNWESCGDFILRRTDGVYAYQLAVVVDYGSMGITQVVRGRDLLNATPQQLLLYERLGYEPPEFFHIPLLVAPDGRRLSKREKDLDLGALQKKYQPEEIIGWLAWKSGLLDQYEPIQARELISLFQWERLTPHDIVVPSCKEKELSITF